MKTIVTGLHTTMLVTILLGVFPFTLKAQHGQHNRTSLTSKEQSLITIAAFTAKGDRTKLQTGLNDGLDAGLTINQLKEAIVHLYAYAGFPRSIRGLQTLMAVLDERKSQGIVDSVGAEASPSPQHPQKYQRGQEILAQLTGISENGPKTGYASFAPIIEVFLKEHLFADIFERDVLTYAERELITVSVLSSIGGVEPMLQSHFKICLNLGFSAEQLEQFIRIVGQTVGEQEAAAAQQVLEKVSTAAN